MSRPYDVLVRVAWAAVYGVALIVLYSLFDPLKTGAQSDPLLFVGALGGGVLVIVLARIDPDR